MKVFLQSSISFTFLLAACGNPQTVQNSNANTANQNQNPPIVQQSAENGLTTVKSQNDFNETYGRLKLAIEKNDQIKIIAEIDHMENAEKAGLTLRPTRLIIFGNPKLGTPLMQDAQTLAIDLPQKFLVYENEKNEVFVAYNNPQYLVKRHSVNQNREELLKISQSLKALTEAATGK